MKSRLYDMIGEQINFQRNLARSKKKTKKKDESREPESLTMFPLYYDKVEKNGDTHGNR